LCFGEHIEGRILLITFTTTSGRQAPNEQAGEANQSILSSGRDTNVAISCSRRGRGGVAFSAFYVVCYKQLWLI